MPTELYVFLLPRDLNPGPLAARRLFQEVIKYFSKCNEKYFKYKRGNQQCSKICVLLFVTSFGYHIHA